MSSPADPTATAPSGATQAAAPSALPAEILRWVESTLGGSVVSAQRQVRWRPAWFLDVRRGDELLQLYWRGHRGTGDLVGKFYGLEREAEIMRLLEKSGIPVPHVYGYCPDPPAILMARVDGQDTGAVSRAPGRDAINADFMDILARMHAVDVAPFAAAGLPRPRTAQEIALADFAAWESVYRRHKRRPHPGIELVARWVKETFPRHRERVSVLQGDAGQFMFRGDEIAAVMDLELAHLGDPLRDLAALLVRDLTEPFGDVPAMLRRYERATGTEIDLGVVRYYLAQFAIETPMALLAATETAVPGVDLAQYLTWAVLLERVAIEAMAAAIGIELAEPELPQAVPTRRGVVHESLLRNLRDEQLPHVVEPMRAYRLDVAIRLSLHLQRTEEIGPELDAQERRELGEVLRHPVADVEAGRAELEELVLRAGPERTPDLMRLLYRSCRREEHLLEPAMGALAHRRVSPLR